MRRSSRKKTKLLVALCGILFLMAAGYSTFNQTLEITETASSNTVWNLYIK